MLPPPSSWSLAAGLGGNSGDIISGGMLSILALGLKGTFAEIFTGSLCAAGTIWFAMRATGLSKSETTGTLGILGRTTSRALSGMVALARHARATWREYCEQSKGKHCTGPPVARHYHQACTHAQTSPRLTAH